VALPGPLRGAAGREVRLLAWAVQNGGPPLLTRPSAIR
jgi:hypothetical protein